MSISMYCSATRIQVLDATASAKKLKVNDWSSTPLPEGALINGIITDEEVLLSVLRETVQQKKLEGKQVSLVVDSSNITLRALTAPTLNKKDVHSFVGRELSMYQEQDAELVYDYAVLDPKLNTGGAAILAVAAGKSFFESYLSVFAAAKLKIKAINVGVNCQIKLARFLSPFLEDTYILAHVDGSNLLLTLFGGGSYLLANRYRLLFHAGSPGFLRELIDHVSSVVQFNKGQKTHKDITALYIDGLGDDATRSVTEGLGVFGIHVLNLPCQEKIEFPAPAGENGEAFVPGRYQYTLGCLVKG